jgi:hypothetical protein
MSIVGAYYAHILTYEHALPLSHGGVKPEKGGYPPLSPLHFNYPTLLAFQSARRNNQQIDN